MSQRILIVDDEKNILRMVGYLLEREGYKISVATTGMQALEKIGAEKPDLVILDIMMPDMSGFDVCQRIRGNPETVHLPIIMFSALSDSKNENRGFEAGADEYLTKLVDPEKIKARVASLLERAQKLNT
jgi:DNA-binding response OmpR family regulator